MKKKLVSMLLVATAIFSLTACGGKNAYEQYVEDATEKANDIQDQAQEVGELVTDLQTLDDEGVSADEAEDEEDPMAIANQLREYTDYMAGPCFGGDEEWAFMYGCKHYLINHIDVEGGINAAPQALGFADYADYVWATCQVNGIPYEGLVKECAESIANSDYEYSYNNLQAAYMLAGRIGEFSFINSLLSLCYNPTSDMLDYDTHVRSALTDVNDGQGWSGLELGYDFSESVNSHYYQYAEQIILDGVYRSLPVPITENNDVWLYFGGSNGGFDDASKRTAMTFIVEDKIATVPITLVIEDIDELSAPSATYYAMDECGMTREEADDFLDGYWSIYKFLDDDKQVFIDGYMSKVNEVGPQDYIDRYKAFLDKHSDEIFWYPADRAEIIFTDPSDIRVNDLKVQTDYMKTVEAAELIAVANALDGYTTFVQTGEMPDDESTFGIVTTLIEKME